MNRKATRSQRDSSDSATETGHPTSHLTAHVNELFQPLEFPDELARRMLTHATHKDGKHGHNARLAFMGRRAMEAYLVLFLHSVPPTVRTPSLDFDLVAARTLNTYLLGEHVASQWSLGRVMRWVPNLPGASKRLEFGEDRSKEQEELRRRLAMTGGEGKAELLRSVGLFKVAGLTVEAIAGGIYHQFGGTVAHRIFHTRILPHLLLPGTVEGLHDSLHDYALEVSDRLSGRPVSSKPEPQGEPETADAPAASHVEVEIPISRKVEFVASSMPFRDSRKRERVDRLIL